MGKFSCEQKHSIWFVPAEEEQKKKNGAADSQKLLQMSVGSRMPLTVWPSHCCSIVWVVKWGILGLTPVRPIVCMTTEANIPAGRALALQ